MGHGDRVWAVAFSPDGNTIASVSGFWNRPGEVVVWDVSTGKVRGRAGEEKGVRSVMFSPDGKTLITGGYFDRTIKLRDPGTGAVRQVLRGPTKPINCVAVAPDGKTVAAVGGSFAEPSVGEVTLWELPIGKERTTLPGHKAVVLSCAFTPDGKMLATASRDQTVGLWDVRAGVERLTFSGHTNDVEFVAFSADGRTLATASWDATVRLWEVASGNARATLKGHSCEVFCLAFSTDGSLLASAGGRRPPNDNNPGEIKLWDLRTQKVLSELQGHSLPIYALAFDPTIKILASGSWDKSVKLWNVMPPKSIAVERRLEIRELETLWAKLADADAAVAYQSMGKLRLSSSQAVAYLQSRLQPAIADPIMQKRVSELIACLGDEEFAIREKASAELAKLGRSAEGALRKHLEDDPDPEIRKRAQILAAKLQGPLRSPEALRGIRAIEILEQLSTPEARQLLAKLSQGAGEARLTMEAKASLNRLERRLARKP
jgi:hypothetical protein